MSEEPQTSVSDQLGNRWLPWLAHSSHGEYTVSSGVCGGSCLIPVEQDMVRHKAPVLLHRCIWHVGTTWDPEVMPAAKLEKLVVVSNLCLLSVVGALLENEAISGLSEGKQTGFRRSSSNAVEMVWTPDDLVAVVSLSSCQCTVLMSCQYIVLISCQCTALMSCQCTILMSC